MSGDATTVFVFQQYDPKPIYHLPSWLGDRSDFGLRDLGDGGQQGTVPCGIASWTWKPGGNNVEHAIRIRWDHARLIGRMCKRCEDLYYGPSA